MTYYYAPVVTKDYMRSMLEGNKRSRSRNSSDYCEVRRKKSKVERSLLTSSQMKNTPSRTEEEQVKATTPLEGTDAIIRNNAVVVSTEAKSSHDNNNATSL